MDGGGEGQKPLGTIAHCDGDPVPGSDSHVVLQCGGQCVDVGEELIEGPPMIAKDDEVRGAVPAA